MADKPNSPSEKELAAALRVLKEAGLRVGKDKAAYKVKTFEVEYETLTAFLALHEERKQKSKHAVTEALQLYIEKYKKS